MVPVVNHLLAMLIMMLTGINNDAKVSLKNGKEVFYLEQKLNGSFLGISLMVV